MFRFSQNFDFCGADARFSCRPGAAGRRLTRDKLAVEAPPATFFRIFFHDNSLKSKKLKVTKNRYIIFDEKHRKSRK